MNASSHAAQVSLNRHAVATDIAKYIKRLSVVEIASMVPSDFGKSLLIEIVTGHELCKIEELDFPFLALLYSQHALRDCILASLKEERRSSNKEALNVSVLSSKNGKLIA